MTTLQTTPYGRISTGEPVTRAILTAANGISVSIISYGGIITEILTPDRHGKFGNIVLGFPDIASYEAHNGDCHFGALIGRFANRVAQGRFTLDGNVFQLPINDGPNTLHGGPQGFGRRLWTLTPCGDDAVTLSLVSADGDAGFPGTLRVAVTYRLEDDGTLDIEYEATTDRPTVVNLTSHSYFNLAGNGSGSVERQVIRINADQYTPVDANLIPTGEIAPVEGTPLDFREPAAIGTRLRDPHPQMMRARGYDHNWVIRSGGGGEPVLAAQAYDPMSLRAVTCLTTHPGLQFYTGNFLDGTKYGSSGSLYRQSEGFALETQHFPDSPNQPGFPSTVLRPGQTYRQRTLLRFRCAAEDGLEF